MFCDCTPIQYIDAFDSQPLIFRTVSCRCIKSLRFDDHRIGCVLFMFFSFNNFSVGYLVVFRRCQCTWTLRNREPYDYKKMNGTRSKCPPINFALEYQFICFSTMFNAIFVQIFFGQANSSECVIQQIHNLERFFFQLFKAFQWK